MLGYAPVAALPLAALDFAAATVLPAFGPMKVRASRWAAPGVRRSAVATPGVRASRPVGSGVRAGYVTEDEGGG